jgi:hypothetical protein
LPRRPDSPAVFFFKLKLRRGRSPRPFLSPRPGPAAARSDPFSASSPILVLWHNNVATTYMHRSIESTCSARESNNLSVQNRPYGHITPTTIHSKSWHGTYTATLSTHLICSPETRRNPATKALSPSSLADFIIGSVIAVIS